LSLSNPSSPHNSNPNCTHMRHCSLTYWQRHHQTACDQAFDIRAKRRIRLPAIAVAFRPLTIRTSQMSEGAEQNHSSGIIEPDRHRCLPVLIVTNGRLPAHHISSRCRCLTASSCMSATICRRRSYRSWHLGAESSIPWD
jgi:hypothetical protein